MQSRNTIALLASAVLTACPDSGEPPASDDAESSSSTTTAGEEPRLDSTSTTGVGESSGDSAIGSTSSSSSGEAPLDDSGGDSSTGAPATVGVFIATGSVGRTIASFDDGMHWTNDASDADGVICTAGTNADLPHYCFEGDKTARGIAYDDGAFFVTFAWAQEAGRTNTVRRTTDGSAWDAVVDPGGFGGIAAGNGVVVLAGPSGTTYMLQSTDAGQTWAESPNGFGTWTNFRHVAFVPGHGGRFIFGGDGNGFDSMAHVVVSEDGAQWATPTTIAAQCPSGFRLTGGFASIDDRLLMVGPNGATCHSDDGGMTWALSDSIPQNLRSHDLVSANGQVYAWSSDTRYATADGQTWTATPLTGGASVGAVAFSPDTGTFVAVTSGYLNGYDAQHFYRSEDGIAWTELAADAYVASHPIIAIAYGRVAASK